MLEPDDHTPTHTLSRRETPRGRTVVWIAIIVGLAALIALAVFGISRLAGGADEATPAPAPVETEPPADSGAPDNENAEAEAELPPGPIRILAMGDMLPHDSVNINADTEAGWNYGQFFTGILPQLDGANAIFCNQEAPSAGVDFGISGYPLFNAPAEFARDLHEVAGCDLISLANNHMGDYGYDALAATLDVWDGLKPVSISGASRNAEEQGEITYGDIDGIRTALVAFAEYSNVAIDGTLVNFMGDTALVDRLLSEARENADLVIVSAHWGTEDTHEPNAAQRNFARLAADYDVDVVIGTGPHVLQPVEWLDRPGGGRTLVWYSIGNMLSSQLTLEQRTGAIAAFEVSLDEGGGSATVTNPSAVLTYMHYDWTADEEARGDLLARQNLSLTPLADADPLLERTRFQVSAADWLASQASVLGPEVTIHER